MSRRRACALLIALLIAGAATALLAERRQPRASASSDPIVAHVVEAAPQIASPLPAPLRAPVLPPMRVVRQSHGPSRIAGVVRHTDGTPAPDVTVTYFALPSKATDEDVDTILSTTSTADEGTFSLDVGPGDYALYANDATLGSPVLSPITVSPGESVTELELVLDGPGVVAGVVVDGAGAPLPASLLIALDSPRIYLARMDTEQQGRFRAARLPNARLLVLALSHPELEGRRELAQPAADVVVRLGPAQAAVVCEVVDWNGEPASGASLSLTYAMGGTLTSTDSDGVARLTGLHGKVTIHVESTNGASAPVEIVADDREQHVRIRLEHAAWVKGRVLDHAGKAAEGTVTVDDGRGIQSSTTLEGGRYSFEAVRSGRYTLAYNAANVSDAASSLSFSTNGSDDVTLPDLRLPAPRMIRGRVIDEHGEPVIGAELDAVSLSDGTFASMGLQAGEDGRFEVPVIGKTRLRATYEGSSSAPLVLGASGDEEVTLMLESAGRLEGIVRGVSPEAEVRCADGVWHPIGASGQYQLACTATATLEVRDGDKTRTFSVDFAPDETSYAEIKWGSQ
ncbi:MAG: hypothetical protein ABI321_03195 [Polyangia bacterium]